MFFVYILFIKDENKIKMKNIFLRKNYYHNYDNNFKYKYVKNYAD